MAQRVSQTTTDHETIRRWAEARGGKPAQVASTARGGQTGIIRIDFPGYTGEGKLEPISWDEWFRKFDESSLALVYEETTAGGQRSNFNKLVARETAEARAEGVRTSRRARRGVRGRGAGRARARRGAGRTSRRGGQRRRGARGRGRGAARGTRRGAGRTRRGTSRTARRTEAARSAGRRGSRTSRRTSRRGSRGTSRRRTRRSR